MSISTCALREEGDTEHHPAAGKHQYFYPRPPRGGRPCEGCSGCRSPAISIHALREEGDLTAWTLQCPAAISIHALREEGDLRGVLSAPSALHFYPRPPRGGRQLCPALFPDVMGISIHALREEGDSGWKPRPPLRCNFYPRPPRGGRPPAGVLARWSIRFLSTPSARRATARATSTQHPQVHFYPRPPRGGRHPNTGNKIYDGVISIHALREEGDLPWCLLLSEFWINFYPRPPTGRKQKFWRFLSTPSARRATMSLLKIWNLLLNFYPRPPRGGRQTRLLTILFSGYFYPRPPRGGRPMLMASLLSPKAISIHALREEGDVSCLTLRAVRPNFYPRPPRGGRQKNLRERFSKARDFYPRPPRGGRPTTRRRWATRNGNFYPRPPRGGRRETYESDRERTHFYPRPPRGGRQQKQRQNLYLQTNYTTFCTNLEEL